MAEDFSNWIASRRAAFDGHARVRMAAIQADGVLGEALRAGVCRPGKRYRPLLTMAVAEGLGVCPDTAAHEAVLDAALATECFHAASLVYDDLPAMDNADRRGDAPSMHRALEAAHPGRGAALAILCAHGLTARGFALLASPRAPSKSRVRVIAHFADAIGAGGMAGGQADEFTALHPALPLHDLSMEVYATHACRKTAPLFAAAASVGALLAGVPDMDYHALGQHLGEAYQLADDLRDIHEDGGQHLPTPARIDPDAVRRALARRLAAANTFSTDRRRVYPLHDFIAWFAGQCGGEPL